jgi:NADH-quinone oxidoreductase subunit J
MQVSVFFFYLLALILISAALTVVLARNPLYSVLALVVAIFALSGLFVLLEAFFVGMILLLVYAGAVLVFFLFVVMCLNLDAVALAAREQAHLQWLGGAVAVLFLSMLGLGLRGFLQAQTMGPSSIRGTIETIGQILFTHYLLPFELTSLLLLIAIFGIVSLAQGALSTGKNAGA